MVTYLEVATRLRIFLEVPTPNIMYEVPSIKSAYFSIKYEGIKLQKCLIACKKGFNVVVRFQYSEIG